jgi:rhodanese-related sulfurtransferase
MFLFNRSGKSQSVKAIDVDEYREQFYKKSKHQLIDVREKSEFKSGHLPKAINIPLGQIKNRLDAISRDQPVVLVCASGNRSGMAAQTLAKAGYDEVYNLKGGTMSWMRNGHKITK